MNTVLLREQERLGLEHGELSALGLKSWVLGIWELGKGLVDHCAVHALAYQSITRRALLAILQARRYDVISTNAFLTKPFIATLLSGPNHEIPLSISPQRPAFPCVIPPSHSHPSTSSSRSVAVSLLTMQSLDLTDLLTSYPTANVALRGSAYPSSPRIPSSRPCHLPAR